MINLPLGASKPIASSIASGFPVVSTITSKGAVGPMLRLPKSFKCLAPAATTCLIFFSHTSHLSIPTIREAPNILATRIKFSPTPPQPTISTDSPALSCASFSITPRAVESPQPSNMTSSSGVSEGTFVMRFSLMIACSANVAIRPLVKVSDPRAYRGKGESIPLLFLQWQQTLSPT